MCQTSDKCGWSPCGGGAFGHRWERGEWPLSEGGGFRLGRGEAGVVFVGEAVVVPVGGRRECSLLEGGRCGLGQRDAGAVSVEGRPV